MTTKEPTMPDTWPTDAANAIEAARDELERLGFETTLLSPTAATCRTCGALVPFGGIDLTWVRVHRAWHEGVCHAEAHSVHAGRVFCDRPAGHDGEHSDGAGGTWATP